MGPAKPPEPLGTAKAGYFIGRQMPFLLPWCKRMHALCNYTVSQKNPCDYVFDDNLNSKRPIVIIFDTVIT